MKILLRIVTGLGLIICLIMLSDLNAQTRRKMELKPLQFKDLNIVRSTGVTKINANASSVTLKPGELLFQRLSTDVIRLRPDDPSMNRNDILPGQDLPFKLYTVNASGNQLDLGVVVDMDGTGMELSEDATEFEGRLFVGLVDREHPGSSEHLPTPVQMLITAQADAVDPTTLQLDHVNLPYTPLMVKAKSPQDPVVVRIRPSFSQDPVRLELDVVRPAIKIATSPGNIDGFGLGEADITINAIGLPSAARKQVTLTATGGSLSIFHVNLDTNGTATAKIRSSGIGTATIRADSAPLQSGETQINFSIPWVFLLTAIIGGIVGTVARKAKKLSLKTVFTGICLGLIGGVGYAVGVNLTGFVLSAYAGEAVTFFVSAIVSYGGHIALPKV